MTKVTSVKICKNVQTKKLKKKKKTAVESSSFSKHEFIKITDEKIVALFNKYTGSNGKKIIL